jgi:hypothetical protein
MLSGATGQLYGNKYTWPFLEEWQAHLNTVGSRQMTYVTNLFAQHRWFDLVPDDDHSVVVSGYGLYSGYGRAFAGTRPYRPPRRGQDTNYVTAARTPDGRLVMAYVPEGQTIGVDMSKLATGVLALVRPHQGDLPARRGLAVRQRRHSRVLASREERRRGHRLGPGAGGVTS